MNQNPPPELSREIGNEKTQSSWIFLVCIMCVRFKKKSNKNPYKLGGVNNA
jgi:hypothetical protein